MAHAQLFRFYEPDPAYAEVGIAFVVDPYASYKEKGLNFGFELELKCEPIYIRPSLTFFPALKDGYTEFNVAVGPNFALGNFDQFRYYTGIRMGLILRNQVIYPTAGFEGGINYQPWRSKVYYGIRATYDRRGDAVFYDGEPWEYSGYVLLGLKI
jgi:hypothetical protein